MILGGMGSVGGVVGTSAASDGSGLCKVLLRLVTVVGQGRG